MKFYERYLSLVILLLGVLGTWVLTPVLVGIVYPEMQERGQFGDLFGSINSLFSGLAFACLIYTIFQQQQQLELQRTDLDLQRQELKLQREEMAASRSELANQVRMQHALFRATVAQIRVAAANARIEGIKMQSDIFIPSGREQFWNNIEKVANDISALADNLDSENPGVVDSPSDRTT